MSNTASWTTSTFLEADRDTFIASDLHKQPSDTRYGEEPIKEGEPASVNAHDIRFGDTTNKNTNDEVEAPATTAHRAAVEDDNKIKKKGQL